MGGIGRRITESIAKFSHKDYENALIQIIIAIDATAKNEFPELSGRGNVGKRCMRLIRNNKDLLALAMTHSLECEIVLGEKALEEIIYDVIRNNIFHEAELPSTITITEDVVVSYLDKRITVPYTLISALILCVVGSPSNSNEQTGNESVLQIYDNVNININEFFGKKDGVMKTMRKVFARWIPRTTPGKIILVQGSLKVE